jgi:aminopeptidase N
MTEWSTDVIWVLQSYITKYKFANADMTQLWHTFDEAAGSRYNIGDVMDTWTRQMGFPVVTVRQLSSRGGRTRYLLEQKRFLVNPEDSYDPTKSPYRSARGYCSHYYWREKK